MKIFSRVFGIIILISVIISTTSCQKVVDFLRLDVIWDNPPEEERTVYAVGVHIEEFNNTCLFVPGIGEVSMPATKDGVTPAFTVGDVVKITFSRPVSEISIMECYPARFGADAVAEAQVKEGDYAIRLLDGEIAFSDKTDNAYEGLSVGDNIILKVVKRDVTDSVETAFTTDYCEGIVTECSDGRYTATLYTGDAKDLLTVLFEYSIELSPKDSADASEEK